MSKAGEAFSVIEVLEALSLERTAIHLSRKDLKRLEKLNEGFRNTLESQDSLETTFSDEAFHNVWIERAAKYLPAED